MALAQSSSDQSTETRTGQASCATRQPSTDDGTWRATFRRTRHVSKLVRFFFWSKQHQTALNVDVERQLLQKRAATWELWCQQKKINCSKIYSEKNKSLVWCVWVLELFLRLTCSTYARLKIRQANKELLPMAVKMIDFKIYTDRFAISIANERKTLWIY